MIHAQPLEERLNQETPSPETTVTSTSPTLAIKTGVRGGASSSFADGALGRMLLPIDATGTTG